MGVTKPSNPVLSILGIYLYRADCSTVEYGSGTLLFLSYGRFNLDPFDCYTDKQIWDVLERTFLSKTVSSSKA